MIQIWRCNSALFYRQSRTHSILKKKCKTSLGVCSISSGVHSENKNAQQYEDCVLNRPKFSLGNQENGNCSYNTLFEYWLQLKRKVNYCLNFYNPTSLVLIWYSNLSNICTVNKFIGRQHWRKQLKNNNNNNKISSKIQNICQIKKTHLWLQIH